MTPPCGYDSRTCPCSRQGLLIHKLEQKREIIINSCGLELPWVINVDRKTKRKVHSTAVLIIGAQAYYLVFYILHNVLVTNTLLSHRYIIISLFTQLYVFLELALDFDAWCARCDFALPLHFTFTLCLHFHLNHCLAFVPFFLSLSDKSSSIFSDIVLTDRRRKQIWIVFHTYWDDTSVIRLTPPKNSDKIFMAANSISAAVKRIGCPYPDLFDMLDLDAQNSRLIHLCRFRTVRSCKKTNRFH